VNAIKAMSDIKDKYDKALNRRTKQITVATAATFLNALLYDNTHNLGLKQGILVCNRDIGMPMHVLPTQNMHFSQITKPSATSQKTPMMKGNQREIGKSFEGAYTHATNRLKKIKTQASHHKPNNK